MVSLKKKNDLLQIYLQTSKLHKTSGSFHLLKKKKKIWLVNFVTVGFMLENYYFFLSVHRASVSAEKNAVSHYSQLVTSIGKNLWSVSEEYD